MLNASGGAAKELFNDGVVHVYIERMLLPYAPCTILAISERAASSN